MSWGEAQALRRPAFCIAENARLDGAVVVSKTAEQENASGFKAATLEYGKLLEQGIDGRDPARKVE